MPIVSGDILFKFSVKTGSAGNSNSGTASGSLGKYISTTQTTTAELNNLFDDVTGDENAASDVKYRCVFIHNSHASLSLLNAVIWLSDEVSGGAAAAIAIDDTVASVIGSSSAQADEIANEGTAPGAGVGAFSSPTSKATGLSIGTIPSGQCRAFWVRRSAANTIAVNNDGASVTIEGDSAA